MFPHIEFDYYGRERFRPSSRTRTELLLRLESGFWTRRWWKYCGDCLKLHPGSEIKESHGRYDSPQERTCYDPGIVVLCLCVHLNARGKIRLIKELEMGKVENPSNWHECELHYPVGKTGITVDVTIALSLTELSELMVRTRYEVRPGVTGDLKPCRLMACPHHDIFAYLRGRPHGQVNDDCRLCQTTIEVDRGDDQSSVEVTRYLGGKSAPTCQTWRHQCETAYGRLHR